MTDEQLLRAAILDVIDGGNGKTRWLLDQDTGDGTLDQSFVDSQRLDFCDAVIARIKQLRKMDDTVEANHPR